MPIAAPTLDTILDTLIPPDAARGRPGAGSLGLAEAVANALPGALDGLLRAVEREAGSAAHFAALDAPAREALLRAAADQGALRALIFQTYLHYYEHPQVQESLGLEARPPYPEGYALEAGDLDLMTPVRDRSKLYRDA